MIDESYGCTYPSEFKIDNTAALLQKKKKGFVIYMNFLYDNIN